MVMEGKAGGTMTTTTTGVNTKSVPVMGIQGLMQQSPSSTYNVSSSTTNSAANVFNNNVSLTTPSNTGVRPTTNSINTFKSPVVITTPPSPLVPQKTILATPGKVTVTRPLTSTTGGSTVSNITSSQNSTPAVGIASTSVSKPTPDKATVTSATTSATSSSSVFAFCAPTTSPALQSGSSTSSATTTSTSVNVNRNGGVVGNFDSGNQSSIIGTGNHSSGSNSNPQSCPTGDVRSGPVVVEPGKQPSGTSDNKSTAYQQFNQQQQQKSGNNFSQKNPSSVTTTTISSTGSTTPQTSKHTSIASTTKTNLSGADVKMESENKINGKSMVPVESTTSDSDSEQIILSRPATAPATLDQGRKNTPAEPKLDMIGEDVKMVIQLIEKSGLVGPVSESHFQSSPPSRPTTAGSDVPPARPSTAEKATFESHYNKAHSKDNVPHLVTTATGENSKSQSGFAAQKARAGLNSTAAAGGDVKHAKQSSDQKTKGSISAASICDQGTNGDKTKNLTSPRSSAGNQLSGRPPRVSRTRPSTASETISTSSGNNNKSPMRILSSATTTPKSGKSPLVSTDATRASNRTSSTPKSDLKVAQRSKSNSGDIRPKSALPSTSSRSRPSSTLYQHTASSAQKGILATAIGTSPSAGQLNSSQNKASPLSTTPKSSRPRTASAKMGDSTAGAGDAKPATLKDQFTVFSRFGDTASDGKHITLSNSDKWMKQAKVIDGKKVTTTDTSICFKKLFKTTKKVPLEDFKKYVEDLAKSKQIEPQVILDKLTNCGAPGLSTATKAAHAGVVERLTDTSKYTGSHKERFDASGKGKGIEGRRDVADSSGYVNSFKTKLDLNKDSSKEGSPSPTPAPVAVPRATPAKEASPPK